MLHTYILCFKAYVSISYSNSQYTYCQLYCVLKHITYVLIIKSIKTISNLQSSRKFLIFCQVVVQMTLSRLQELWKFIV